MKKIIDFGKMRFEVCCNLLPPRGDFLSFSTFAISNDLVASHRFDMAEDSSPEEIEHITTLKQADAMQDIFAKLVYEKMNLNRERKILK